MTDKNRRRILRTGGLKPALLPDQGRQDQLIGPKPKANQAVIKADHVAIIPVKATEIEALSYHPSPMTPTGCAL